MHVAVKVTVQGHSGAPKMTRTRNFKVSSYTINDNIEFQEQCVADYMAMYPAYAMHEAAFTRNRPGDETIVETLLRAYVRNVDIRDVD